HPLSTASSGHWPRPCPLSSGRSRGHGTPPPPRLSETQPTLFHEAKLWLGARQADEADAMSEDIERGLVIIRRLYFGAATAAPDGWDSLRGVLRIETLVHDKTGKLVSQDNRYLISSLPESRLTKDHWLLSDSAGASRPLTKFSRPLSPNDHPWIEAHPRA